MLRFIFFILFIYLTISEYNFAENAVAEEGTVPISGVSADMVAVPEGFFIMGSEDSAPNEKPLRKVYLDAYEIDKTEMTVSAYKVCVAAGECRIPLMKYSDYDWFNWGGEGRDQHPINGVDWDQAKTYCEWVGKRLPTEAEWEKAARGISGKRYPWGDSAPDCSSAVMRDKSGEGCGEATTSPVGSKPKGVSPYGALDMVGNVWEWTADWYGLYDESQKHNPHGPAFGSKRVLRGGSYFDAAELFWITERLSSSPEEALDIFGFRCAR